MHLCVIQSNRLDIEMRCSFKSVKLLYCRLLNNSISNLSVFLATFITPLLNSYAVILTQNSVDTR